MEEQSKEEVKSSQEEFIAKEFVPAFSRRETVEEGSQANAKQDILRPRQLCLLGLLEFGGIVIFQQVTLALFYKLAGFSIALSASLSASLIGIYFLIRCHYMNRFLGETYQALSPRENLKLVAQGVGLCFLVAITYDQVLKFFNYVPEPQNVEALLGGENFHLVIAYFMLVYSAPLWEEVAFRGILQNSLQRTLQPAIAILLSGVIFGVIHFDFDQMIPLILLGCVFGWMYNKSKSIFPSIIAHSVVNTMGAVSLFSGMTEEAREAVRKASALVSNWLTLL